MFGLFNFVFDIISQKRWQKLFLLFHISNLCFVPSLGFTNIVIWLFRANMFAFNYFRRNFVHFLLNVCSQNKQHLQTEQTNLSQYQLVTYLLPFLIFYQPKIMWYIIKFHIDHLCCWISTCKMIFQFILNMHDKFQICLHMYDEFLIFLINISLKSGPFFNPAINCLQDKPWVYAHLLDIQRRLGQDQFPLIPQTYHPDHTHMVSCDLISPVLCLDLAEAPLSISWGDKLYGRANWVLVSFHSTLTFQAKSWSTPAHYAHHFHVHIWHFRMIGNKSNIRGQKASKIGC